MSKESARFEQAMRKILSVSHDELQRREKEWKEKKNEKRKKSKKPSASREAV